MFQVKQRLLERTGVLVSATSLCRPKSSMAMSGGEEALDGGPEGGGDGGPGCLRRVHVVPVEVPARVVAERVLPRAVLVLLAAVAVRAEALAARTKQRAREPIAASTDASAALCCTAPALASGSQPV